MILEKSIVDMEGNHISINYNTDADKITPESTVCLTCGCTKINGHLKMFRVGDMKGLQPWLKRRLHNTKANDNVVLCESCLSEFNSIPSRENL